MTTVELIDVKLITDEQYWLNLGVSYPAIHELNDKQQEISLENILKSLNKAGLIELASVFQLENDDNNIKCIRNNILSISTNEIKLLLLLNDFQRRKKRIIQDYYIMHGPGSIRTPLVQLYLLFQSEPSNLFKVLTYHYWNNRSSGNILSFNNNIKKEKAKEVFTKQILKDELTDMLCESSSGENEYKVFSYVVIDKCKFIGLIYKQVSDTAIPDYDQAVRNKGIEILLFAINTDSNYIEIKSKIDYENKAIKKYIENRFNGFLTVNEDEIYQDYDKDIVLSSMLSSSTASGKSINDFLIDKITFRSSLIKNSPEFMLHTANIDVWPSIDDAHSKDLVNVKSLKDIKSFSLKSNGVTRTVRSIVRGNGNVIYTMDDSNIDKSKLQSIKRKFLHKFGIPMYQEIINNKFDEGKADQIDHIMNQSRYYEVISPELKEVYKELISKKLMSEANIKYLRCANKNCLSESEFNKTENNECPNCDSEMIIKNEKTVNFKKSNVNKYVKNIINIWCQESEWEIKNDSEMTFVDNKYKFIRVQRKKDGEIVHVFVADKNINKRVLNELHKQMIPLIVVFIGQSATFIERFTDECIHAITFGSLYSKDTTKIPDLFDNIFDSLKLRAKNFVASAANKAYNSITKILIEPDAILKKDYTPGNLEDDGYALIKDMFPNAVKWGKEQSGKPLPEGVFSLSYLELGKSKRSRVFSFDFKLTYKKEGYPLDISERRKAVDYVTNLNKSHLLSSFTGNNSLSGHIFISNRLNDNQVKNTIKYFEEKMDEFHTTKPMFMTTETLIYLHSNYRRHYEVIKSRINYYHNWIYETLIHKSNYITKETIDKIFEKILSNDYIETDTLNMNRLTLEQTEDYE